MISVRALSVLCFCRSSGRHDHEELKQGADEAVEQADPLIEKGTLCVITVRALSVLCL